MAGRGMAPKPPGTRRRRNEPQRGEWVDLEPLAKPKLPPADQSWSPNAKRMWKAWREDAVTSQYGPGDVAAIFELARQYDDLQASEQRLRMDGLGLTPKGKRDLRWRTPAEVETLQERSLATVTPLLIKDPRGEVA